MDSILKRLMWSCPTMPSTVLLNTSRFKTAEAARTFFLQKKVWATLLATAGVKPGMEWQLQLPSEDHIVTFVRGRVNMGYIVFWFLTGPTHSKLLLSEPSVCRTQMQLPPPQPMEIDRLHHEQRTRLGEGVGKIFCDSTHMTSQAKLFHYVCMWHSISKISNAGLSSQRRLTNWSGPDLKVFKR